MFFGQAIVPAAVPCGEHIGVLLKRSRKLGKILLIFNQVTNRYNVMAQLRNLIEVLHAPLLVHLVLQDILS